MQLQLQVNGQVHELSAPADATLLDVLRNQLGLVGAKRGCGSGDCGTCTVQISGQPALACLTLAAAAEGESILTVEGIGVDAPHPLQVAFIEHDAFQCGFCTPGQIMAGIACLEAGAADSDDRVRAWMSGNLCRCAAYPQIVAAVRSLHR